MSNRGVKRKRGDKGNYSRANGVTGQNRTANMPQHGFYGMKQAHIGAPNGLYNARYSASTRGPEKKFVDTYQEQQGIPKGFGTTPAAATFKLLNAIAQGTDFNQRVGRTICVKSFTLNWAASAERVTSQILYDPATIAAQQQYPVNNPYTFGVRVMLVYDRQPNGAIPVINALLWDMANTVYPNPGTSVYKTTTHAFNNLNNKDRFMVLLDKKFTLGSEGGNLGVFVKKHRRINLETQYNSSGGLATGVDIQTGAFYLLTFGEQQDRTDDVANTEVFNWPDPLTGPNTVNQGLFGYWGVRLRYTDV